MEKSIYDVAEKINLKKENLIPYGLDKLKIDTSKETFGKNRKGKIILCTAITPT